MAPYGCAVLAYRDIHVALMILCVIQHTFACGWDETLISRYGCAVPVPVYRDIHVALMIPCVIQHTLA